MITYRLATYEDNQQLIGLTASTGMMGETALRIDRKPDFFSLLKMRGETKVFIALDGETIIGSLCVTLQQVYVNGRIFPLQYIGDFKVAAAYRNKGIGLQLCNNMADYVIAVGADLAFLNVSKGNTKPISFFKNRPGVPDFENIGIFNIHQFIGKKKKAFHPRYKIEVVAADEETITFLNSYYSKYEMGSVITKEKLDGTQVFTILEDDKIIAAMCLIDTMQVKQNVVTKLSWKMRYPLKIINATGSLLGISKMPLLNEPVRMMYIKYLAVNNREKQIVRLLINHARNIAYEKLYSFVSIGLHQRDPLNSSFAGLLKLTVNSVGMLLSIKNNKALIEKVKQGVPFEDYSLV
ncbi:GNAT family N-acetyltransferase [Ferruginibacter sp.]|nr:GNAT family N-acetyltransferase [Ferruginibacter sp.]